MDFDLNSIKYRNFFEKIVLIILCWSWSDEECWWDLCETIFIAFVDAALRKTGGDNTPSISYFQKKVNKSNF